MTTQSKPRTRLTAKQEAFCQNYVALNNGTQSAIKAGYPPGTAKVIATQNLTKLYLKERIAELRANLPIDPDIADVKERKRHLTEIARHQTETLVTAGQRTTAIDVLNKLERLYSEGSSVSIDNRTLNIYVKDTETKELLGQVAERTNRLIEAKE